MIATPADDSIELHYQPLVDCTGTTVGLKALMRWHHQQRGGISPEAFIPIFENSGLILPLSSWALSRACGDAAYWTEPLIVAVNLSAVQFQQQDLPGLVDGVLASSGLAPGRLELEMTESALLADPAGTRATLRALSALGVRIALDQFGTGSSAPSYLVDYPLSKLKIDTSFVAGIETSASARWIVHTLIELGHSLGLAVAAEGVETPQQRAYLTAQSCDLMQGFLFGRPAAIDSFAALTGHPPAAVSHARRLAPPPFAVSRPFQETAQMRGAA